MKKLVLIALSAFAVSCNGIIGNGYKISGEIKGFPDGTTVYLEKQGESTATGIIGVDTTVIKGGKFVFEGKTEEPLMHRVRFDQIGGFMMILEKGNIEVKGTKDSLGMAKVTGTHSNDELHKYNTNMVNIQKKMMAFEKQNMKTFEEAQAKKDTVTIEKLKKEYLKLNDEIVESNKVYVEKNPDSFLSVLIIQGMFSNPQADVVKIRKYFDDLDSDLKETTTGKKLKTQIEEFEKATGKKK